MKKQKGFVPTLILLGIVLAVMIAGGAYYLGVHKSSTPVSSPTPVVNSQTPQAITVPSPAETANWKTYSGKFYSFKYPSNWQTRPSGFDGVFAFGPADNQNVHFVVDENTHINAAEIPDNLANQALGNNESVLAKKTTKVDDHYTVIQEGQSEPGIRIEAYIGDVKSVSNFVAQDGGPRTTNGTMSIYMEIKDNNKDTLILNRQIFNQILSTFKFTQ